MTSYSLHPEDLFERVLFGTATTEEQSHVADHLRHCAACRAELRLHRIVAASGTALTASEVSDASIESVLRRLRPPASVAELEGPPIARVRAVRSAARRRAVLLAVAATLLALAAAAFVLLERSPTAPARGPRSASNSRPAPVAALSRTIEPSAVAATPAPASSPELGTSTSARPLPSAFSPIVRAQPAELSAADLFARATAARRAGDAAAASRDYRRLQGLYPQSSEALVSRLSLGRLLLGSAPKEALAQFDAYLQRRGPLQAEALVGKARALSALGRTGEARKAWLDVIAVAPSSPYADQARKNLAQP